MRTRTALQALTAVLADALQTMATDGHADEANRLAGRAYAALRREHPDQARRINALMHQLTRISQTTKEQTMPTTDPQLDVRTEPPARRHGYLIYDTYDKLTREGFVLVNDHDPKPLYYQLAAEHPDQFRWGTTSEEGPEAWRRADRPVRNDEGLDADREYPAPCAPAERRVVSATRLELVVLNGAGADRDREPLLARGHATGRRRARRARLLDRVSAPRVAR